MSYDAEVGIVGAGPGGALAAELLADRGADVVVIDPRAPWEKPCGGGLTAGLFRELPEFSELRSDCNRVDSVRFETERATVEVPLENPLWVTARARMAAWQLRRFTGAGARLISREVRSVSRERRGWLISTTGAGEFRTWFLVGADGAASRVRKVGAPGVKIVRAAARVSHPRNPSPSGNHLAVIRFLRGLDGYLWDFPRADHSSIGIGALSGRWNRRRFDGEVHRFTSARGGAARGTELLGASIPVAGHPRGTNYEALGSVDFALLGDAAGLADPLTGEGIRNALRSAVCLSEAYARDRSFRSYAAALASTFEAGFRTSRITHSLILKGLLLRLLTEAAARNRLAWAALAAMMNAGNEHDSGLEALARLYRFRRSQPT